MSYEFGGEVPKSEVNSVYFELDKPEEPEGIGPFFEDHLDAIRKAVDAIVPVVGSSKARISVLVKGHANPGHCPADGYDDESISITVSVVEDGTVDTDLIPEGEQTVTDLALYENAMVEEDEATDYEAFTVTELKSELDTRGVEYSSDMRKADLIELLVQDDAAV